MVDSQDRAHLELIHDRLMRGDRTAVAVLWSLLHSKLFGELARRNSYADSEQLSDSITDAILEYVESPERFDPARSVPLDRYLALSARRNLANSLQSERRRKRRERRASEKKPEADVALDPAARNLFQEEHRLAETRREELLAALTDSKDKEILVLRLQGERNTAVFAQILNLCHLPIQEQRKAVKKHKDRIAVFLRRKGLLP